MKKHVLQNSKSVRIIFSIFVAFLFSIPVYAGEWITDTESGCKVWNSDPQHNATVAYSGECVGGKAKGKGSLTWYVDGKKYQNIEGESKEGKLHGNISFVQYSNGKIEARGKTDFVNGKAHGITIITGYDGHGEIYVHFECEMKDGKLNGKGTKKIFDNGKLDLVLESNFTEKGAQGKGIRTEYKNGKKYTYYEGHFKDNFPRGDGSMTVYNDKGEKVIYFKGYFNANVEGNSIINGTRILYEDEKQISHYEGAFKINEFNPHGEGTETDAEGNKYSGSFQNGKKHGMGKYTFPDGNSYKGLWENGERIKIF